MQPGKQLIQEVRAGFIKQGTTLSEYCKKNKIDGGNVYRLLRGDWDGVKAKVIRSQIIEASGADSSKIKDS